ncbi:hypothetical protein QBC47DRAFT_204815 [Echria macrotheca]|uniref:Golgi apparatus membrane protein TVP38 n=1 Tax=Echria macrotheca TaxID=438768 RepID=A0AAJ0BAY7_9PEZI|nr:hypothetical protein QBC47DRAFT_204815 [Echria macrotheca]
MFPQQDRPPSLAGLNALTSSSSSISTSSTSPRSPTSQHHKPSSSGLASPRLLSPSQQQPSSSPSSSSLPPWARRPSTTSARRLSTRRNPYSLHNHHQPDGGPLHTRLLRWTASLVHQALRLFQSLSPLYQLLVLVGLLCAAVLSLLALIYSHRIFAALGPIAQSWRSLRGGWILVWLLTFICAFPPMIGYSSAVTIAGFVYGFPLGWPVAATATVAGSTAAFFSSRGVFSGYVHRLVGKDKRFIALGQVLRRDGLGVLAMIRFCPLPYSLSNGFLATVPSIRPGGFALATACATPKLLVHVFIGSRLALLAESGDHMSAGDRAINYASMFVGGTLGFVVGLLIYRRTMARAAELAAAEGGGMVDPDGEDAGLMRNEEGVDEEGGNLLDPDAAALVMDDDDISLWENDGVGEEDGGGGGGGGGMYRDAWDEEAAVGGPGTGIGNGSKR